MVAAPKHLSLPFLFCKYLECNRLIAKVRTNIVSFEQFTKAGSAGICEYMYSNSYKCIMFESWQKNKLVNSQELKLFEYCTKANGKAVCLFPLRVGIYNVKSNLENQKS